MRHRDVTAGPFAVWNGDDTGWEDIAEDCVLHDSRRSDPVVGREAIRAVVAEYRSTLPDLRVDAGESIGAADLIAHTWTASVGGTTAMRGVSIGRIRGGRLAESWIVAADEPG